MDFSLGELRRAFEHVKANHGCAGVDGVTLHRFGSRIDLNLRILQDQLDRSVYRPLPLVKVLIPKKNGEKRTLCIPTVVDRIAQTAVLGRIEPVLEAEFEEISYAYRKGRGVRQAVMKIKELREEGYRYVADADIDDFFSSVDHDRLLVRLEEAIGDDAIIDLVRLWLKSEVWDGKVLRHLEKGLPQGSPISPILSNLFLDELDEKVEKMGFKYVRYADDFIIFARDAAEAMEGLEISEQILDGLSLELDDKEVTSFERGFSYLGVVFLNDLILKPFDAPKKKRGVVAFPAPMDMGAYFASRDRERPHDNPLHHRAKLHS